MNPGSNRIARALLVLIAIVMFATLSGCATMSNPANPKDPFEGFNRTMFKFNDKLDDVALRPAATMYQTVLPSFVQTGIGNFFGNLGDVWTAVNNLMQGNVDKGMSDVMRVALNSTLGLAGVLDIGSEAGLTKHKEDFGQTLGVWGIKPGPYVVLPVFGSYTLRDTIVFPIDFNADPWTYKYPVRWRNVGTAVRLIDRRASLLGASNLIEEAALDRYEFIRDAYMQRREGQIKDGKGMPDEEREVSPDTKLEKVHLKNPVGESNTVVNQQSTVAVSSNSMSGQLNAEAPPVPGTTSSLPNQEKHEKTE